MDDIKELLIIGNGFDLSVGLKTTYKDFFTRRYSEEVLKEVSDFKESQEVEIIKLKKLHDVNFWDIFFIIQYLDDWNINKSWANIEVEIKDLVTESKKSNKFRKNQINFNGNSLTFLKTGKINNEKLANLLLEKCGIAINVAINEFLFTELNKFEFNFSQYIGYLVYSDSSYDVKSRSLFNNLVESAETTFLLSFNYSELNLNNCWNIENVHGKSKQKIIFGIEHKDIDVGKKEYKFTKTYRKLLLNLSDNNHKSLPEKIEVIKFFGHSLAEADYSYFQSIFDFYSVYNTSINIEFFFNVFDEGQRDSIIETQLQAVTNLFNVYGSTMNNKDHGKNLVHKLMLENRIHITEVDNYGERKG
ncbi:AbiH family protein [Carnobacterium maltaromaticum]|uniref:AbiH family protein n=1 Tax=Carnobacterium maltaromaticum TaxID=2751 RepID=UPI00191BC196|nr:AbiH family protein [Carnobacterium maltaromaticum]CAD5896398.1 conserved hypothetical protein [Carnobacterium maltaromaticum]